MHNTQAGDAQQDEGQRGDQRGASEAAHVRPGDGAWGVLPLVIRQGISNTYALIF